MKSDRREFGLINPLKRDIKRKGIKAKSRDLSPIYLRKAKILQKPSGEGLCTCLFANSINIGTERGNVAFGHNIGATTRFMAKLVLAHKSLANSLFSMGQVLQFELNFQGLGQILISLGFLVFQRYYYFWS